MKKIIVAMVLALLVSLTPSFAAPAAECDPEQLSCLPSPEECSTGDFTGP